MRYLLKHKKFPGIYVASICRGSAVWGEKADSGYWNCLSNVQAVVAKNQGNYCYKTYPLYELVHIVEDPEPPKVWEVVPDFKLKEVSKA